MNSYGEMRTSLTMATTNRKEKEAYIKDKQSSQAAFYKGQRVNGLVTAVGDNISLQIGKQVVTASKDINPQAVPGDWMLFEVLQVTDNKIIMELAGSEITQKKALVTLLRPKSDRETFLSRKAQSEKQMEKDKEYRNNRDKIEDILNRLTEQDYKRLEKEGFPIEELTVSGLEAAMGRIKTTSPRETIAPSEDSAAQTDLLTIEGTKQRLRQANLPVTEENIQKVLTAMSMYESLQQPGEGTLYYLVSNALPPTIGNIYKAQHSNITPESKSQLTENTWNELLPQVKDLITSAGFEINDENLTRAKGLLEQGLPLTAENYVYYSSLKEYSKPGQEVVIDNMLEGMGEGISPNDTILMNHNKEALKDMVNKLKDLGEEEIKDALWKDKKLTLKELINQRQEELSSERSSKRELTMDQQAEAVRSLRQLEEIRLKMTVESAARMERRGYHIETKPLENVVQELRRLEEEYDRKLLMEADIKGDSEQVEILRITRESIEQLKTSPSYILGSTLHIRKQITVPELLGEGTRLSAELGKANEAYESLMTQPSREYGDSIQKAFNKSDSLLEELNLEDTIYNLRAIRILGYNQMEISREAIEEIKNYDLKVNTLMKNLHPAVTVRMIKDGINPMELSIDEINQKIQDIRKEQGISEDERFGTFLRRLDKEKALTEKERKAYIGIYRLLHNIDKSDGAALGAVLKAGREITLSHMLTAVRSFQKGSIDARVDDQFGALESISFDKERITEQIIPAFYRESEGDEDRDNQSTSYLAAKQEFTSSAINQFLAGLTPEFISSVQNSLLAAGQPLLSSTKGIWETIKDIPMEQLFDQLLSSDRVEADEMANYETKIQELRQTYQTSDQAIRFLEDFKVPCTTANILMAGEILSNGSTLFKKLRLLQENSPIEKNNLPLKEMDSLVDTIIDKKSMNETYEELETEVRTIIEDEIQSDRIDTRRLYELKTLGAQISLMKNLAKKEFYQIPIETKNGLTNLNLTVIRGTKKMGRVAIFLESDKLGKVKADLSLKDKEINGYIASDSRRGCELLQDIRPELDNNLKDDGITIKQLQVCFSTIGKEPYSYQYPLEEDLGGNANPEMERQLYRLAKLMVNLFRRAESTDKE